MNCIIVDDNEMARSSMKQLASQVEDLTVVGECSNAMEAYNMMQAQPVDILFLDIDLPEMTGLELTRRLGDNKPLVVFATRTNDHAIDAFDLNAADYILKPVKPSRFLQTIDKVREMLHLRKVSIAKAEKDFVFIRDNGILKRLMIDEICFLEAMGDYVKVFTQQRFYAVHTTLRNVEDKLPSTRFLRVHRSYIVALNKVDKIEEGVIVINKKPVPVADAYRSTLNKRLNIL